MLNNVRRTELFKRGVLRPFMFLRAGLNRWVDHCADAAALREAALVFQELCGAEGVKASSELLQQYERIKELGNPAVTKRQLRVHEHSCQSMRR